MVKRLVLGMERDTGVKRRRRKKGKKRERHDEAFEKRMEESSVICYVVSVSL